MRRLFATIGVPIGRGRAVVASFAVAAVAILGLEAALANAGATFVVTSTSDVLDVRPGDGRCATLGGACTIRVEKAGMVSEVLVLKVRSRKAPRLTIRWPATEEPST
jgi:hypothetical protein